jgi:glycosyltransferase involved in cell wall biosynthesis
MNSHAEVERVDVGDDGIRVRGTLVGGDGATELTARRRSDGHELTVPAAFDGPSFDVTVPYASLSWRDDAEPDFWDLYLGELRLGRHLDGVGDKRHAYVFPRHAAGERRFRPFYNVRNHLFIRTGPVEDDAVVAAAAPPVAPPRRRVIPPHELWLHRLAHALAGIVLRRRPAGTKPKVTILIANAYGMGGTVRTCLNVAGFLARSHEVEIISAQRHSDRPFFPFPPGVKVRVADDRRDRPLGGRAGRVRELLRPHRSRLLFPGDLRFAGSCTLWTDLMLVRHLWDVRAGVVMGTRPALNLLAPALRRRGTTVIGQEHMNLETHTPQRQAEIARRYPSLDAVTVLTERDHRTYARALGDAVRLEQIPNAAPELAAAAPTLDRPVVVAAGRLTTQKGFDLLIGAFAQVADRHPGWTLRICGDGPQRRRLQALILEHGLSNDVLLMGAVDRLDEQMAQASLYVLSSRFEGLPMVMIEAMSLGLPVVSFDCPTGPREVIQNGRSGVLVEDGDVDALARAMLAVIDDPEHRRRLGAGAAQRAKDYALDSIGPRWEALIAELSRRPERR